MFEFSYKIISKKIFKTKICNTSDKKYKIDSFLLEYIFVFVFPVTFLFLYLIKFKFMFKFLFKSNYDTFNL